MKKQLSIIFLFFAGILSVNAQQKYNRPQLDNKDSWSMIVVPDVQNYVKYNRNQPILDLMVRWIETNLDSLNIKMVVCVGDLVEQNDIINNGHDGDQTSQKQWEFVSSTFGRLNGKVPYIAATGNHDYSINPQGIRNSRYNDFFKIDDNWQNRKIIVQNSRNEQGVPTIENAAYEIKGLHGKDYLFLTMEYAPRDTIVTWGKKIAAMTQYKDHRLVLITHAYLSEKDKRTTAAPKWIYYEPYSINNQIQKSAKIELPEANSGQQLWEKLIEPAQNIEMVICGHISGEGYKLDKNAAGKNVHQMLFDMQSEGGGHRYGNGGDGWIRILEFYPDNKTVKVKTFSPLFAISPSTQHLAWKQDARNEYTMELSK